MIKSFPIITAYEGLCDTLNSEAFGLVTFKDFETKEKPKSKIAKVPFVLPQEEVDFEELEYRRTTYYSLKKIIQGSSKRAEAPCPHFQICGGCRLQHMSLDFYKRFKLEKLNKSLETYEINTNIAELIVIPPGLRRKANIEGIKKSGTIFLGFHRFRGHQIINIDACLIIDPKILQKLPAIRKMLETLLKDFQKVEIFIIDMPSGMEFGLEIHSTKVLTDIQTQILSNFAQEQNFSRMYFKYGLNTTKIFESGESYIELAGFKVDIHPWAFMQTSVEAEKTILNTISEFLVGFRPSKALDCFCGRGLYSLFLCKTYSNINILAVDLDKDGIEALQKVALKSALQLKATQRDLFANPLKKTEMDDIELAIINPPRAGAENQCKELLNSKIICIIYVSCNPETFARDTKILSPSYDLEKIVPIDQFIWSLHLEVVALFRKKS